MHLESQTSFFECSSLSNVPDSKRVPLKSNSHTHTLTRKLQIVLLGSPPSRRERPISTRAVHTDRDKKKVSFSFARSDPRARDSPFASSSLARLQFGARETKDDDVCDDFRVSNMYISLGFLHLSLFSLFFFSFFFYSREKLVYKK